MASNFGRLSDKLKDADLERRMEEEEVRTRHPFRIRIYTL